MTISVRCPQCQTKIKGSDRLVGRQVTCPHCSRLFSIAEIPAEPTPPTVAEQDPLAVAESTGYTEQPSELKEVDADPRRRWPIIAALGGAVGLLLIVVGF